MKLLVLYFFSMFVCVFVNAQTKHIVQRGETLELIANRYGVVPKLIKDANPLVDEYYTGLTIFIPENIESFKIEKEGIKKEIENTLENNKDVLIYDLKGKVKKCIWYSKNDTFGPEEFEEYHSDEFDSCGKVLHGDGFLIKRDQLNRIIQTRNRVDNEAYLFLDEFHGFLYCNYNYNIDGYVESEICWQQEDGMLFPEYTSKVTYFYNSEGNIEKVIDKDISGSGRIDLVKEYKYLSFDKYGNWTERKFVDPFNLSEETQKRVIAYY